MCLSCVDELKLINDCASFFACCHYQSIFYISHPSIAVHNKTFIAVILFKIQSFIGGVISKLFSILYSVKCLRFVLYYIKIRYNNGIWQTPSFEFVWYYDTYLLLVKFLGPHWEFSQNWQDCCGNPGAVEQFRYCPGMKPVTVDSAEASCNAHRQWVDCDPHLTHTNKTFHTDHHLNYYMFSLFNEMSDTHLSQILRKYFVFYIFLNGY